MDWSKLAALGYRPARDFKAGLEETTDWYRRNLCRYGVRGLGHVLPGAGRHQRPSNRRSPTRRDSQTSSSKSTSTTGRAQAAMSIPL